MQSATGQSSVRTTCQRGFTLIELILVLTLLAIAASFVAPAMQNFMRGRTLDGEATRLLSVTRAAQSRAVSEGLPVLLWLDAGQGAYGVEREAQSDAADPRALRFSVKDSVTLTVPNAEPAPTQRCHFPAIRFLPDGSIDETSPVVVRLSDVTGAVLWLGQTRNRMSYEIRSANP